MQITHVIRGLEYVASMRKDLNLYGARLEETSLPPCWRHILPTNYMCNLHGVSSMMWAKFVSWEAVRFIKYEVVYDVFTGAKIPMTSSCQRDAFGVDLKRKRHA